MHLKSIYQLGMYYWVNIRKMGYIEVKERPTYPQNWSVYNSVQTSEKADFLKFLHDLCTGLQDPPQTNGRPRIPLGDAIFSICYKIYSTVSGRRFISDLREAQAKGYIDRTPHFNSIFNYLENEGLTPILCDLITKTSRPVASIEKNFAADSSGFTASVYSRWYEHKYGKAKQHEWVKVHLMCGVKTNIVTAVEIGDKNANDSPMLPDLVRATAENFSIKHVLADKAYGSLKNYDAINAIGATPYIPFKDYQRRKDPETVRNPSYKARKNVLWNKMYHLFKFHEDEFMTHYHQRSNVETTFSMIKAKFGGNVRSKGEVAMKNEVLCKIICHNICVCLMEMRELGIGVDFMPQPTM